MMRDKRNLYILFTRLMNIKLVEGVCKGPLFANTVGKRMSITEMDVLFHELLWLVQERNPSAISDDIKIEKEYSVFRFIKTRSDIGVMKCGYT